MSRVLSNEIVAPEPHSTRPTFGKAWEHFPRWLRIFLTIVLIAAAILIAVFIKD